MTDAASPVWKQLCALLTRAFPQFYTIEADGPLLMDLGNDGWILEVKPDGAVVCQYGVAMDEVLALMSEGTAEDIGTDEAAKQAKYFIQPAVSKFRPLLLQSGFSEETDINDEFVAVTFTRSVDVGNPAKVQDLIHWCRREIGGMA
jgi:hypothetical protein